MAQSSLRNNKRLFSVSGGDPSLPDRVTYLENNEYKILYFQTISAATGTITKPTNSTILLDQFYEGGDAIVETLVNGQPSGQSPLTAGGAVVSVSSFDTSGNFTLSGTPSAFDVALVYILKIKAEDYQNLTIANIMAMEDLNPVTQSITNGDTTHAPSSDAVYDALALKSNLTDIRFKSDMQLICEALGSTIIASTFPIDRITSSYTLVDTRMDVQAVYIRESKTITGVKWFQGVQGNYTADNYNGVGLYSYDGAGTLTLVASSTDDGNIWKASANSFGSKAFSSTYNASPGIYFIALLYNYSSQTTAPTIGSTGALLFITAFDFTNSAKFRANRGSVSSFPATQSMTGGTGLGPINSSLFLSLY